MANVMHRLIALLGWVLALAPAWAAGAASSEPAPLADRSLLLAVARAGTRLVAVGDRGHILTSADEGRSWTQAPVPTRAMLTGVSFPDAQHGWAVGHDGVILATADGGLTWQRQDNGADLETVYLDVLFLDPQHGQAVGAYGKFMSTADGGKTWTAGHPIADEVHYNRINGSNRRVYLAGESGMLLASGPEWKRLPVPYDGSLFGVLLLKDRTLLTFGLRGHILRSDDDGATWAPLNSDVKVLIMGGIELRNGHVVLAGQGGHFFISRDGGQTFGHWKPADFGTGVAALIETTDGAVLTVGEAGAVRIVLP